MPKDYHDIVQVFQETVTQEMPDIVVIGLQEVIKSTVRALVKNFFAGNAEELTQEWIKVICRALNHVN